MKLQDKGRVIGYCGFLLNKGGKLTVGGENEEKIEIDKNYQGEGLGKKLLLETIDLVKAYATGVH